jgi:hypothetical protein
MEAEELDRIFRAKLDELEQVPDLVWDDSSAWNKVSPKIKTPSGKFWTWGLMGTAVLLSSLVWFMKPDQASVPKTERVIKETAIPPLKKVDTLIGTVTATLSPTKDLSKNRSVPSPKTLLEAPDIPSRLERPRPFGRKAKEYWLIEPRLQLNRAVKSLHLDPRDLTEDPKSPRGFYMPQTPVLELHVGNSLNLYNVFKLFETVRDQGGTFRYSYKYKPNSFGNSLIPFQKQDPRVFYINDYDK